MHEDLIPPKSFGENARLLIPGMKDLAVLAAVAVLTGVFIAFPVGLVASWTEADHPFRIALITFAAVQALVWLFALSRWLAMISRLEGAYDPVYYEDNQQPDEDQGAQSVRVELIEDEGQKGTYASLPASPDQLQALAMGLKQGLTLADSHWSGGGKLFSRPAFTALKGELLKRGLAAWNSPGTPARGLHLTRAGEAVFRYFLTVDSPPTLRSHKQQPGA